MKASEFESEKSPDPRSVPWAGVVVYYVLAVAISTPFRFQMMRWYRELELPYHLTVLKYVLEGAGPVVGAIVAWKFFPAARRTVTLQGTSRVRSRIAAAVPIVVFAVIGSGQAQGVNPHVAGLLLGVMVYVYCLFEEIGWRGYLQDAFGGLTVFRWTLLIGVLWFVWHLTFLQSGFDPHQAFFLGALIFGAWGLGNVVRKTHSLAVSALFHLAVNVLLFDGAVTGVPMNERLVGVGFCVAVGIYLTATWPTPSNAPPKIALDTVAETS